MRFYIGFNIGKCYIYIIAILYNMATYSTASGSDKQNWRKALNTLKVRMVVFLLKSCFWGSIGRFGKAPGRFSLIFIGIGPQETW